MYLHMVLSTHVILLQKASPLAKKRRRTVVQQTAVALVQTAEVCLGGRYIQVITCQPAPNWRDCRRRAQFDILRGSMTMSFLSTKDCKGTVKPCAVVGGGGGGGGTEQCNSITGTHAQCPIQYIVNRKK